MDRLNATRLLQALVAAGANCYAPMADAWIKKVALEIGLRDGKLYSALAYADAGLARRQPERGLDLSDERRRSLGFTALNHQNKIGSTTNCSRAMRRGGSGLHAEASFLA